MSQKLELIGFAGENNNQLKTSIAHYLEQKGIAFIMTENESAVGMGSPTEAQHPTIKFENHFISFGDASRIKDGLSQLHHLLHEHQHGKSKSCLNCANCRCKEK